MPRLNGSHVANQVTHTACTHMAAFKRRKTLLHLILLTNELKQKTEGPNQQRTRWEAHGTPNHLSGCHVKRPQSRGWRGAPGNSQAYQQLRTLLQKRGPVASPWDEPVLS